jgi:uncharacterized SAM-binding protein YcdF (DUF218 family)
LAIGALGGLLAKDLKLQSIVSIWGDNVPWVVATAIVGAGLWMTRWRWLLAGATACLGALWLAAAFTPLCEWLARDLPRQDTVAAADAVYVLGSNVQMDGELTAEAMSRLLHGLELLGQGLAPRLVLPELRPPKPSYKAAAQKIMRNLGMTQEVLSIGPVVRTRDEAVALGALSREHGWSRVLVVTSPPHSRRASAALEREGIEVLSSPSTQTQFDLEKLDEAGDRIKAFPTLVHERVGLWLYKRRGWMK